MQAVWVWYWRKDSEMDRLFSLFQQRVEVNGIKSDWASVLSGVPQGTVLGLVLFSLYINDITTDLDSEIRLFADDCVCYIEVKGTEDTVKLQEDIDRLGCWARKWGMRFQGKCNIMQITRKRIKKINASYNLEGTVLDNVENIKYLGITITDDLKWTHMSAISAQRLIGPLSFLDVIYQHAHRTIKSRHIKDWCAQTWSMVVQFGTPQVYFFKRNLRRYRKGKLDLWQATTSMKLGAWLAF